MKTLVKLLMTASLAAPVSMAPQALGSDQEIVVDLGEIEQSAYYLALQAREAKSFVEDELNGSKGRSTVAKAIRLTRLLNVLAVEAAEAAADGASDDELLATYEEIEPLFYQIDSTKRSLARYYRSQRRDVEEVFNDIRTAFYVYKKSVTGSY